MPAQAPLPHHAQTRCGWAQPQASKLAAHDQHDSDLHWGTHLGIALAARLAGGGGGQGVGQTGKVLVHAHLSRRQAAQPGAQLFRQLAWHALDDGCIHVLLAALQRPAASLQCRESSSWEGWAGSGVGDRVED